jgi:hypothetical protein
VESFFHC